MMKKKICCATLLLTVIFISVELHAQDAGMKTLNTTRSNIKNNRVAEENPVQSQCSVSIISCAKGCDVVFSNDVKSPRDAASGLATGRRMHKPISFAVSSADNSVTEVTSPRDIASGMASGQRTAGNPIGGLTIKGGKNPGGNQFSNLVVNDGKFSLPADCPDGEYDLILSWSWGTSNSGNSKTYCQCHFILTLESGACMAINTKGTGASNK
jgi:hypothetical protein